MAQIHQTNCYGAIKIRPAAPGAVRSWNESDFPVGDGGPIPTPHDLFPPSRAIEEMEKPSEGHMKTKANVFCSP